MSTVWETRRRVLLERLEALVDQLRKEQPSAEKTLEEHTVRLLAGVLMLLRQHLVNKRGQCNYCRGATWRFWHRRSQCMVSVTLDFTMSQPLDVVWRRLLADDTAQPEPR